MPGATSEMGTPASRRQASWNERVVVLGDRVRREAQGLADRLRIRAKLPL